MVAATMVSEAAEMVVVATVMPEAAGGRSTRPCRPLDLAMISQSVTV
jgi:hypothetical protein